MANPPENMNAERGGPEVAAAGAGARNVPETGIPYGSLDNQPTIEAFLRRTGYTKVKYLQVFPGISIGGYLREPEEIDSLPSDRYFISRHNRPEVMSLIDNYGDYHQLSYNSSTSEQTIYSQLWHTSPLPHSMIDLIKIANGWRPNGYAGEHNPIDHMARYFESLRPGPAVGGARHKPRRKTHRRRRA